MGDVKYCKTGKTQHKSRISAEIQLEELLRAPTKGRRKKKAGLDIYTCPFCKCLHVGHSQANY